nr:leucine-rich repeat domain-containing protein [Candidatus Sigynarchaeota archaeon]
MSDLPPGIEDLHDDRLTLVRGMDGWYSNGASFTQICFVYERQYRALKEVGASDESFGAYPNGMRQFLVYNGHVVEMIFDHDTISTDIDFTTFPFLISLEFRECKLKMIPPSIAKIPRLQNFQFHDNKIQEEGNIIEIKFPIAEIDLNYNGLKKIPFSFSYLEKIVSLDIRGNKLKELPAWVYDCTNLEKLYCGDNGNLEFSPRVKQLTKLKTLTIDKWPLPTIPDILQDIPNLEDFWGWQGEIQELPAWIGKWKKLKFLSFRSNKIKVIPDSIGNLES